jgi:peptidoglycan/LPS O-acetylase OafA/YrhL
LTRPFNRLVGWQRRTLYIVGTLLLLTGVVWLAVHYSVGEGAGQLPHPIEAWSMRLHGLAAFAGLFTLGFLAATHIPRGWRHTREHHWGGQRKTGLALCALAAVLVATSYMLYYFAPEPVRPALGWVHAFAGVAMGVLIFVHRRNKIAESRRKAR